MLTHRSEENSGWSIGSPVGDKDVGHRAKALTAPSLQLGPLGGAGRGRRFSTFPSPVADQAQEELEEHFVASSVGEMWEVVDMAQQEDKTSENAAIRDHLVDLAFCLNLASIVVFL